MLRTFAELEALVRDRIPESLTLDYKADFTNDLEKAKKELAKDVSAFANSQGGTLIIGISQDKHSGAPLWPPSGIPRLINDRQQTVEWVMQGLNQNIAQRVDIAAWSIELEGSDRCVIVIDVPVSPRAPHMVTYQQDNRFHRRYFRRHQYESLPAEEHEVREIFYRGLRYADAVNALLESRGYLDRQREDFGRNELTDKLAVFRRSSESASSFVSFVAVPMLLKPDPLFFPSGTLAAWYNTVQNMPHPQLGIAIASGKMRSTFDGLLCVDDASAAFLKYGRPKVAGGGDGVWAVVPRPRAWRGG